ncbi:MAG TPA: hypothetical protein VFB75_20515 [Burkholderiales bacterium]|nr:hypothetical protein [Burkholderiales bacterium]
MQRQDLDQKNGRQPNRSVQLVLVRANGPLFYSVTAASLLEVEVSLAAERLLHFFGADKVFAQWTRTEWLPRKVARTKQIRDYVQSIWPEYDWHAGHEQYRAWADERGTGAHRPTAAHEALARCVASAQSGVFYRSLARWAEDPWLRSLARAIAQEEASSFAQFRGLYDRQLRSQGFGCTAAWSTALACVRTARDHQVPRAFMAISAQCAAHVPFPVLGYPEFVARMGAVIERHGDLATPERVLLRTWKRSARRSVEQPGQRTPGWFRPVLRAAA